MTRKRRNRRTASEKPGPAGFLIVDKPAGQTSHDVVDAARRWFGTRRVGHLGTLDPQATGVLPLAVREATKLAPFFDASEKSYVGTVRFGAETETLDGEGKVVRTFDGDLPDTETVSRALERFVGEIEQVPPMYSAVKRNGVPLHKLARRGEEVERPPKRVVIHRLELLRFESPDAEIAVDCSAGTYVRTLAADLGSALGCGAFLKSLRRVRSGPFFEADSLTVEELDELAGADKIGDKILSPAEALGLPTLELPDEPARRVMHGGDISAGTVFRAAPGAKVVALDASGDLLAVMEMRPDRRLWPIRVLKSADS